MGWSVRRNASEKRGCARRSSKSRMPASAETALQNRLAVSAAVSRMPSRNSA